MSPISPQVRDSCTISLNTIQVDGHRNLRRDKAPLALFFTFLMITVSVAEVVDLLTAALLATAGLMLTRCLTAVEVSLGVVAVKPERYNQCYRYCMEAEW